MSTVLTLLLASAHAHREDVSYLLAAADDGELTVVVELSWIDLVGPDGTPPDDVDELVALGPAADALIRDHVGLATADGPLALPPPTGFEPTQRAGGRFVQVRYDLDDPVGELGIEAHLCDALGPAHKTVARVHRADRTEYAVFDLREPRFRFAGAPVPRGVPVWPALVGALGLALAAASRRLLAPR